MFTSIYPSTSSNDHSGSAVKMNDDNNKIKDDNKIEDYETKHNKMNKEVACKVVKITRH